MGISMVTIFGNDIHPLTCDTLPRVNALREFATNLRNIPSPQFDPSSYRDQTQRSLQPSRWEEFLGCEAAQFQCLIAIAVTFCLDGVHGFDLVAVITIHLMVTRSSRIVQLMSGVAAAGGDIPVWRIQILWCEDSLKRSDEEDKGGVQVRVVSRSRCWIDRWTAEASFLQFSLFEYLDHHGCDGFLLLLFLLPRCAVHSKPRCHFQVDDCFT